MRRITGAAFLSLDGVMQAPGGGGEDPTGGFVHEGWLAGIDDDEIGATVAQLFAPPFALLLGRKTFDIFAAHWPYVTGEEAGFGAALTAADKHVVTRGDAPLSWDNSHRLADIDAIAALKASEGPDLLIQGSSTLYPPLLAAGLIDRLVTITAPVLLERGKRLFGGGTPAMTLALARHRVTARGSVIAWYQPTGPVATGSFARHQPSARELARRTTIAATGDW